MDIVPCSVRVDTDAATRQHDKVLHGKFGESVGVDALPVDGIRAEEERVGFRVYRLELFDGGFARSKSEASLDDARLLQSGPDALKTARVFRVRVVVAAHALVDAAKQNRKEKKTICNVS